MPKYIFCIALLVSGNLWAQKPNMVMGSTIEGATFCFANAAKQLYPNVKLSNTGKKPKNQDREKVYLVDFGTKDYDWKAISTLCGEGGVLWQNSGSSVNDWYLDFTPDQRAALDCAVTAQKNDVLKSAKFDLGDIATLCGGTFEWISEARLKCAADGVTKAVTSGNHKRLANVCSHAKPGDEDPDKLLKEVAYTQDRITTILGATPDNASDQREFVNEHPQPAGPVRSPSQEE